LYTDIIGMIILKMIPKIIMIMIHIICLWFCS